MLLDRTCQQCGFAFRGGPRAYYCPTCRRERQRVQNRVYKERRKAGRARTLGSTDRCVRCGVSYTVTGANQRFCSDCAPIHAKEYDRRTSLAYYHKHKHRINPIRNKRRQRGLRKCAWCQAEFLAPGRRTRYCSSECKRQAINMLWRKRYYKRKNNSPNKASY